MSNEFQNNLNTIISKSLPGHSVDCVVFGYEDFELKVLLLKWKHENLWSLPGGFIFENEDLDAAAKRILKEKTDVEQMFLSQFHTFGENKESRMNSQKNSTRFNNFTQNDLFGGNSYLNRINNRLITTGYLVLVDIKKTVITIDSYSKKYDWVNVNSVPKLSLNHNTVLKRALHQLRIELNYLPVGKSLLPEKFTMQEVQKLYEAILKKTLERSNFQRKMLKLGVFIREEKQLTGAAHKAPYLYRFDKEKYNKLLATGIGFGY